MTFETTVTLIGSASIVGSLLVLAGGIFQNRQRSERERMWGSADGILVGASIVLDSGTADGGSSFEVRVAYEYEVAGVKHVGRRIGEMSRLHANRSGAERELGRYRPGARVVVRYDPTQPATALLDLDSGHSLLRVTAGAVLGLGMGIGLCAVAHVDFAHVFARLVPR